MQRPTTYRDNGTIGALLDEYEKAIYELITVIQGLSEAQLVAIVDTETKDEECRSIQTILTHIVESGYTYAVETRKWLGEAASYRDKKTLPTADAYIAALHEMFQYNEQLFEDHPNLPLYEKDPNKKILVRWGQRFNPNQLFSHAIVHVLKHRRQIARFKHRLEVV